MFGGGPVNLTGKDPGEEKAEEEGTKHGSKYTFKGGTHHHDEHPKLTPVSYTHLTLPTKRIV